MPGRATLAAACAALVTLPFLIVATPSAPDAAAIDRGPGDAGRPDGPAYQPPVPGPVVDPFRPPPHPYGPGNRGLTYATTPGDAVRAAAPGEVLFAGAVAGTLHVTVRHADGLRTSYSFLAGVDVRAGQAVAGGARLGTAATRLHFGVRRPDGTYLDPAALIAGRMAGRPRLVPGLEEGQVALQADERRSLLALVRSLALGASDVAGDLVADRVALLDHYRRAADPTERVSRLVGGLRRWADARSTCTPAGEPPPRIGHRRLAVLVAGFGSTGQAAAIDDLDTGAIGYAPADVVRFSYRGGRVPDPTDDRSLAAIPARGYDAADAQRDLAAAGAHLADLLADVAAAHPGLPIDVIAHSQGGVVARLALQGGDQRDDGDPGAGGPASPPAGPRGVATLVTLGTPHQGADLATASQVHRGPTTGPRWAELLAASQGMWADSPAVAQLSEASGVVAGLRASPPPAHVRFVSIGARGDIVVPNERTVVADRPHVVVPLVGLAAHSDLPGSPAATREVALAVGGRAPTCASVGDALIDLVASQAITTSIDSYGLSRLVAPGGG